jgi:hypothetical protein
MRHAPNPYLCQRSEVVSTEEEESCLVEIAVSIMGLFPDINTDTLSLRILKFLSPLMQPKMPEWHKRKPAESKVSHIGSRRDAGGFYSRPVTKKLTYEHHEKIYS